MYRANLALSFLEIILGCIGLFASSLQFILIFRYKKPRHPFDLTMMSLSMADILFCVLNVIDGICSFTYPSLNKTVDIIYLFGVHMALTSFFFHITSIASERLLAVAVPLKFQQIVTNKCCKRTLIIIWLLAAVVAVFEDQHVFSLGFNIIFNFSIFICGGAIIIIYSVICFKMYKQQNVVGPSQQRGTARSPSRRIIFHSLFVTISFLFCTFPFAAVTIRNNKESKPKVAAHIFLLVNPCLDSLLFFIVKYYDKICPNCCRSQQETEDTDNHQEIP